MDESSVVEEPNFSSSYISSIAEEPLISVSTDDELSDGEETTSIKSVGDEMLEFGPKFTSTPAKRKRNACEHESSDSSMGEEPLRLAQMHRWRNTRRLPSSEIVKMMTTYRMVTSLRVTVQLIPTSPTSKIKRFSECLKMMIVIARTL